MIRAKEALEIADCYNELHEQITKIENGIIKAAEKGEYKIIYTTGQYRQMHPSLRDFLTHKGYYVKPVYSEVDFCRVQGYKISWEYRI